MMTSDLFSLSSRLLDALNMIQPLVSLVAFASSLVYVFVCASKHLKGVTYQHLLVDSVVSTAYAALNSWTWLIRCGALCAYGYAYWSKVYELYVFIYFKQSLELFMMLVEIHLTYVKLNSFRFTSVSPAASKYTALHYAKNCVNISS